MMPIFTPYEKQNEVSSLLPTLFINASDDLLRSKVEEIYISFGLQEALKKEWLSAELWFNTLKEIQHYSGEDFIYETAKKINLINSKETESGLENALHSLVSAYEKNHRNGECGEIKITKFDIENQRAYVQCQTPYPDKFWQGIILNTAKKNKPKNAVSIFVSINQILPIRNDGGEHTTFIIKWKASASQIFE